MSLGFIRRLAVHINIADVYWMSEFTTWLIDSNPLYLGMSKYDLLPYNSNFKSYFLRGEKILSFRGELKAANCEIEINEHFSELPLACTAGQWGRVNHSQNGGSGPLSVTNNYNQDSLGKQSESRACQDASTHVFGLRDFGMDACKRAYKYIQPLNLSPCVDFVQS